MELPSHLVGPILAIGFLALLAGLLRWTYGHQRDQPGPNPDRSGTDEGLLCQVAVVPTPEAADVLRSRLARDGIRSRVTRTADGTGQRIMVFPGDEIDARLVLAKRE